jgi:hypothetical protein
MNPQPTEQEINDAAMYKYEQAFILHGLNDPHILFHGKMAKEYHRIYDQEIEGETQQESENRKIEARGWMKAMLFARGELDPLTPFPKRPELVKTPANTSDE